MSIENLEKKVVQWAEERGIFQKSTEWTRFDKFFEEVLELEDELLPVDCSDPDIEKIKLEAGDVLVTLINLIHPFGLDLETCLSAAYEKIKNRTGQMVAGQFVRDREGER